MAQDDSKGEGPNPDGGFPNAHSPTPDAFASGGLSLEDFQQDERLRQLEAIGAPGTLLAPKSIRRNSSELPARSSADTTNVKPIGLRSAPGST